MDAPQEIKARLDVADVVGEYLQLKPAGSGSFRACCPFHQEKTPSFYVNRPRQTWHCFGCNQGGDIISFVQMMEGLEFPEALQILAEKAGVTLPEYDSRGSSERKRLHEVNDLAMRYFHSQLLTAPNADIARQYVNKRGLDDLTTDVWMLGYAPEGWENLVPALSSKGVTDDELLKAGLAQKGDRGIYDRFRGRIMFPIWDVHGRVVGFTGRILSDDKKEAKYVNTPETFVYKKSSILYGLDKARGEIKRQDLAVLVEGNMDVISSHQFGVSNVVASSGTALTLDQLNLIKRFTQKIAIAFDADNAGKSATIRGFDLARQLDFNIKVITLPPEAGKDPDDAVRKNPELWKNAIKDAKPIIDWMYMSAFKTHDSAKPDGKKEIAKELLPEFARIIDAVERDAWISRLANDLEISQGALREALRTNSVAPKKNVIPVRSMLQNEQNTAKVNPQPTKTRHEELLERIWAILCLKPELETLAKESLKGYYLPVPQEKEKLDYLAVLADKEFTEQDKETLEEEIIAAAKTLSEAGLTGKRASLQRLMKEAELAGDQDKITALIEEFNKLTNT